MKLIKGENMKKNDKILSTGRCKAFVTGNRLLKKILVISALTLLLMSSICSAESFVSKPDGKNVKFNTVNFFPLTNLYVDKESYTVGETVTFGIESTLDKNISEGLVTVEKEEVTGWKTGFSNIFINPADPNPIKIYDVSINTPPPYSDISFEKLLNPEITTSFEKTEDVTACIRSDILSEDSSVLLYLENHPKLINEISDAIEDILTETPELLADLEVLAEEVEEQVTTQNIVTDGQMSSLQTSSLGLIDIIKRILRYFIPAPPGITVTCMYSGTGLVSVNFIADTSNTVYSVTVVTDGNIIGYVGDGWFTWPWASRAFSYTFRGTGWHYLIAYPTIFENIDWLRSLYTSGFLVYIYGERFVTIPIENISHTVTIQPVVDETSAVEVEIYSGKELVKAQIKVDLNAKESIIEIGDISATTNKPLEITNSKLYIGGPTGKKLVNIAPDIALQQAKLSKVDSLELKDNEKPVYEIKGVKESKLLWLIPVNMEVAVHINAETGATEKIEKPWWGFLAS